MKRRTLVFIISSISASYLGVSYLQPDQPLSELSLDRYADADYYIEELSLKQFNSDGSLNSVVTADKLQHFKSNDSSIIDAPRVLVTSETDSRWHLRASQGQLNHGSNHLALQRQVKLEQYQATSPTRISTDSLELDLNHKTAATMDKVEISAPNGTTRATGMHADFNAEQIQLRADVETQASANQQGSRGE